MLRMNSKLFTRNQSLQFDANASKKNTLKSENKNAYTEEISHFLSFVTQNILMTVSH